MCECWHVRGGFGMLMASLWIAFQSPVFIGDHFLNQVGMLVYPPHHPSLLFIGWLFLFGVGIVQVAIGYQSAVRDGDTADPVPTTALMIACVVAMCWGLYLGMPFLAKGIYLTTIGACYGNLLLYMTAETRRIRLLRAQEAQWFAKFGPQTDTAAMLLQALAHVSAERDALRLSNAMFAALLAELRDIRAPIVIDGEVVLSHG